MLPVRLPPPLLSRRTASRLTSMWLLALGLATSCMSVTPPGAVFDTQPPGARVVIDGRDTGYATPCQIALDEDEDYLVRLELDGFEPAEIRLEENSSTHVISWSMAEAYNVDWYWFNLPIFLPITDMLIPWRKDESHSPWRVFVHLRPAFDG